MPSRDTGWSGEPMAALAPNDAPPTAAEIAEAQADAPPTDAEIAEASADAPPSEAEIAEATSTQQSTLDYFLGGEDHDRQMSVGRTNSREPEAPFVPVGGNPAAALGSFLMNPEARKLLDSQVTWGQENVGAPVARAVIRGQEADGQSSPTGKVFNRELLSSIAGKGIRDYNITPEEKARADYALSDNVPDLYLPGGTRVPGKDLAKGAVAGIGHPLTYPFGLEGLAAKAVTPLLAKAGPALAKAGHALVRTGANVAENVALEGAMSFADSNVSAEEAKQRMTGAGATAALFSAVTPGTYKYDGPSLKREVPSLTTAPPVQTFVPGDRIYLKGKNGQKAPLLVTAIEGDKLIVRGKKGSDIFEVPIDHAVNAVPPGIANTNGVVPGRPGLEGGPATPDEIAHFADPDTDNIIALHRQFPSVEKLKKFMSNWTDARHKAPSNIAHHVRELQAAKTMGEERDLILAKMKRMFPDNAGFAAFDKDLNKAFHAENAADVDNIMSKHGAVWTQAKDEIHNMIRMRNELDAAFHAHTGEAFDTGFGMSLDDMSEQYVARRYMAYTHPEKWRAMLNKDENVLKNAVEYIKQQNNKAPYSEEYIAFELQKLLQDKNPAGAWQSSSVNPYGKGSMLARKSIPEPIRKFLGEWESGVLNFAETMATQRAIVHHLDAWKNVTADPRVFSPGPPIGLAPNELAKWIEVPPNKRKFGAAAGGYMRRDVGEAFIEMSDVLPQSASIARAVSRFFKGNLTKWNPGAHVRSLVDNMDAAVAHSGLGYVNHLKEAHDALKAYAADPLAEGPGAIVYEGKKYGYHFSNVAGLDLKKSSFEQLKKFDKAFGEGNKLADVISGLAEIARKPGDAAADLFGYQDDVIRLASNMSLRKKLIDSGMSPEDAARECARRTNLFFMNAQNVGRNIEAGRNGGVGIAAPFLTAQSEDIRRKINMTREFGRSLAAGDYGYSARMLGWHGLFYRTVLVGGGSAWALMHGVDDKQYEDAKKRQTKGSQTYKPLNTILPFRDDSGRFQAIDFTPYSLPAQYLMGNPDAPAWAIELAKKMPGNMQAGTEAALGGAANALTNAATGFVSRPVGTVVRGVLEAGGVTRATPNFNKQYLDGQGSLANILNAMGEFGALPLGPAKIAKDIMRMEDQKSPYDVPLTPGQVAARALGLKVEPVPPTGLQSGMELAREIKDATKGFKAGAMKKQDLKEPTKNRIEQIIRNRK